MEQELLEHFPIERVPLSELRPHPRNYRGHPTDQIAHIKQSILEHGLYRNIVIARDGTILAGHGVALACAELGLADVAVRRLPLAPNDARALKVLAGDNELGHLAEPDDRLLAEILKEIKQFDPAGLMGTGFDDLMLANLVYISRPEGEIADHQEAAQWVGMPSYDAGAEPYKLIINFLDEAARSSFMQEHGLKKTGQNGKSWSSSWPPKDKEDLLSVRFEAPV